MSSWSASTYPPPPRRSRSRSPPRGSYPPRPYVDPAYPPDPYRTDWEVYDRDRAWPAHERERSTYDYGRRGRSRSPPLDEGRKRRRSASPYERDRYDPRPRYSDDYDTHSRTHGYSSPRRAQYPIPFPTSSRRPPPDPHTFEYPATLKQYAEWFRFFYPQLAIEEDNADKAAEQEANDGTKPRNGIKSRWEKYKKEFSASQLQTMFEHHRKSPWFAEKYNPAIEYKKLRQRARKEGWKGRVHSFLFDLEAGKFDPDSTGSEPDPGSLVKETAANGGFAQTDSNGIASAVEESKPAGGEDEMQFTMDTEEDGGDHEASRAEANGKASTDTKQIIRGDEISVMPEGNQVMIRTIPPDIGRVKLEDACSKLPGFTYLALGDPLQKRSYYRAGWLRFRDDADMPAVMIELSEKKIEGFKLHVTHIVRPFTSRIRYTPEAAGKLERMTKDLANVKRLASMLEEEAAALRALPAPEVTSNESKVSGEDHVMTDTSANEPPELEENPSQAVERRIEKVMSDLSEQGLADTRDEKVYETKKTMVALDLYLAYIRAAYHTCYYCAIVSDHLEELQRKCLVHVRKPLAAAPSEEVNAGESDKANEGDKDREPEKEPLAKEKLHDRDWRRNDDRWLEWLDSKVALLINKDGVDPREYGGKSYDEELAKAVGPYIKQEDEGKFRCKTCSKLFKASSFVEKHIANKHPELVKFLEDIPYFNNFALDPHRIQPFSHPPPSVGNSQPPPPQAYGIQGPPAYYPPDFNRPPYHGSYGPSYPPSYANGGYWDHSGYQYGLPSYPVPPLPPPRRDEATTARRLSDRITGYAHGYDQPTESSALPAAAGLPPKPVSSVEAGPSRRGGRGTGGSGSAFLPPPPSDAQEDPRAAAGKKVSYHDMDLVAEGDVELTY